jgi:hypothetical protein
VAEARCSADPGASQGEVAAWFVSHRIPHLEDGFVFGSATEHEREGAAAVEREEGPAGEAATLLAVQQEEERLLNRRRQSDPGGGILLQVKHESWVRAGMPGLDRAHAKVASDSGES